jgi:hypothetical protein
MNKKLLSFIGFFSLSILIFSLVSVSLVLADTSTDEFDRTKLVDNPGDDEDVLYTYYGDTWNVKSISVGYGKFTTYYDVSGNLLAEEYLGYPLRNRYYTYYFNGLLGTITKRENGKDTLTSFEYDDQARIVKQRTRIDWKNKATEKTFAYDSQSRISKIAYPGKTIEYTYYNEGVLKDKIDTIKETFTYTDGQKTSSIAYYLYDTKGNIVDVTDNTGASVKYVYDTIDYTCQEVKCINTVCDNPENCYTFYDATGQPYQCAEYTFVDSTCSYDRLKTRIINNFQVNLDYTGDGSISKYTSVAESGNKDYIPIEQYNDDGFLTEDDYYKYSYDSQDKLANLEIKEALENKNVEFSYDQEENINKAIYASNNYEQYYYDALGNMFLIDYYYPKTAPTSVFTGAAIKNFFFNLFSSITGHVIETTTADTALVTYIATSPGDEDSFVSESDFDLLVSEYEGENGVIVNDIANWACEDFDMFGNSSYYDSLFNSSFVFDNGNYYFDSCQDNDTLVESYCGINIFQSWTQKVHKTRTESCRYGCMYGACLSYNISSPDVNFNGFNFSSNGNYIVAKANIEDGDVAIPLIYGNGTDFLGNGKSELDKLEISSSNQLFYDASDSGNRFIASWTNGIELESYYLTARVRYDSDNGKNYVIVKNVLTGVENEKESNVTTEEMLFGNVVLTIGDSRYNNDGTKYVALTCDDCSFNNIYTSDGYSLNLMPIVLPMRDIFLSVNNSFGISNEYLAYWEYDQATIMKQELNAICSDSDGGLNYYARGNVKGYEVNPYDFNNPIYVNLNDTCTITGPNLLYEYHCVDPYPGINYPSVERVLYNCTYGCANGACLNQTELPPEPTNLTTG